MSLEDSFRPVRAELEALELRLRRGLAEDGEPGAAIRPLLEAGGKRIRPGLVLLAAALGGDLELDRVAPGALAVELTHAATLVHDDVIDSSPIRRGVPSLLASSGAGTAIVVADYYFSKGYLELAGSEQPELVALLAETVMGMCLGEMRQQDARYRYRLSEPEYWERIDLKTGRLLVLSCRVGARLAGLDQAWEGALATYGRHLGRAFQITDDVLDYTADVNSLGKPVGHDLAEGHATLPLVLTLADPGTAALLESILVEGRALDATEVATVVRAVTVSGAIERAIGAAEREAEAGAMALSALPESVAKEALTELVMEVVTRSG